MRRDRTCSARRIRAWRRSWPAAAAASRSVHAAWCIRLSGHAAASAPICVASQPTTWRRPISCAAIGTAAVGGVLGGILWWLLLPRRGSIISYFALFFAIGLGYAHRRGGKLGFEPEARRRAAGDGGVRRRHRLSASERASGLRPAGGERPLRLRDGGAGDSGGHWAASLGLLAARNEKPRLYSPGYFFSSRILAEDEGEHDDQREHADHEDEDAPDFGPDVAEVHHAGHATRGRGRRRRRGRLGAFVALEMGATRARAAAGGGTIRLRPFRLSRGLPAGCLLIVSPPC